MCFVASVCSDECFCIGLRAPTVANLREWMLQHPTYEILRPSALPTSYPSASSTPRQIPKKASPGVLKSREIIKSRGQLIRSKLNDDGTVKEDATQSSMKQFLVKRPSVDDEEYDPMKIKIKRQDDIVNVSIKDGARNIIRKDDLRLKEKQRQIKLIPVQPILKVSDKGKSW